MKLEIHYSGEWAALYIDGKLDIVGDSYLAEEKAFELFGVRQVQDDAFMLGQTARDGVAKTLEEVAAHQAARADRRAKALALREEAARLEARATALEG